jgi:hypothetical protein
MPQSAPLIRGLWLWQLCCIAPSEKKHCVICKHQLLMRASFFEFLGQPPPKGRLERSKAWILANMDLRCHARADMEACLAQRLASFMQQDTASFPELVPHGCIRPAATSKSIPQSWPKAVHKKPCWFMHWAVKPEAPQAIVISRHGKNGA